MKQKLINFCAKIKLAFKYLRVRKKLKNKKYDCAYIGTPYYGNLGDQQIRASSLEFLKKCGKNVVEIDYNMYYLLKMQNLPHINLIVLQGGGNLGDVYLSDQFLKDDVIRNFKDKKIIVFPQTIHYEDKSQNGEMDTTKNIFSKHKNLTLVAREKVSFDMMQKDFSNNEILLTPDIVLSSDYTKKYNFKRKNQVLFLCRSDLEKVVSNDKLLSLKDNLSSLYKIVEDDTDKGYNVFDVTRDKELKNTFKKIAKSKVVITDRLHGMIFCAITNTPCIVMSNYNHKIKSTYFDWLKDIDYIKFVEDIGNIDVSFVKKLSEKKGNWEALYNQFKPLEDKIKE